MVDNKEFSKIKKTYLENYFIDKTKVKIKKKYNFFFEIISLNIFSKKKKRSKKK